jgi:hypothetical protein
MKRSKISEMINKACREYESASSGRPDNVFVSTLKELQGLGFLPATTTAHLDGSIVVMRLDKSNELWCLRREQKTAINNKKPEPLKSSNFLYLK